MHIIRPEPLGRRLASTKSLAKSLAENLTKSLAETCWNFCRDSWPESRIVLYAWLSARLSPRLVFLRGTAYQESRERLETTTLPIVPTLVGRRCTRVAPGLLYATQLPYTQGFRIPIFFSHNCNQVASQRYWITSIFNFFSLSTAPSPNAVVTGISMISRFILLTEPQTLRIDCLRQNPWRQFRTLC